MKKTLIVAGMLALTGCINSPTDYPITAATCPIELRDARMTAENVIPLAIAQPLSMTREVVFGCDIGHPVIGIVGPVLCDIGISGKGIITDFAIGPGKGNLSSGEIQIIMEDSTMVRAIVRDRDWDRQFGGGKNCKARIDLVLDELRTNPIIIRPSVQTAADAQ